MRHLLTINPATDEAAIAVSGAEVRVRVEDKRLVIDVCADGGEPFDEEVFAVYRPRRDGQRASIPVRVLRGGEGLNTFMLDR